MRVRRAGNRIVHFGFWVGMATALLASGSLLTQRACAPAGDRDLARAYRIEPIALGYLMAVRTELLRRHARGDTVWNRDTVHRAASVRPFWEELRQAATVRVAIVYDQATAVLAERVAYWLTALDLPHVAVSLAEPAASRTDAALGGGRIRLSLRKASDRIHAQVLDCRLPFVEFSNPSGAVPRTRLLSVPPDRPVEEAALRIVHRFLAWYRGCLNRLIDQARHASSGRDRLEAAARYLFLTPDWDGITVLEWDSTLRTTLGISPLRLLYAPPSTAVVGSPLATGDWPLGFIATEPVVAGRWPALIRCVRDGAELVLVSRTGDGRTGAVSTACWYVDRYEVTVQQYVRYLLLTRRGERWQHPRQLTAAERAAYPVTLVCWYEATQYLQWAGRNLPTHALWRRLAARAVPFAPSGHLSASAYSARDVHPLGLVNLRSGVAEWLRDCVRGSRLAPDEPIACPQRWATPLPWQAHAHGASTRPLPADYRSPWLGFRGVLLIGKRTGDQA